MNMIGKEITRLTAVCRWYVCVRLDSSRNCCNVGLTVVISDSGATTTVGPSQRIGRARCIRVIERLA